MPSFVSRAAACAVPLCLALTGCPGPDPVGVPRADLASLDMPDLVSHVTGSYDWHHATPYPSLAVRFEGLWPRDADGRVAPRPAGFWEDLEAALGDGMTLVRARDGAVVAGSIQRGSFDLDGVERGGDPEALVFSLVPAEPIASLEEGWYVFRLDLAALHALGLVVEPTERQTHEDRVLHARLYVGSRPMWRAARVRCVPFDDECLVSAQTTEPLPVPVEGTLEVRYDGEPVACTALGTASGWGVGVRCPYTQHTEDGGTLIEVDFVSDAVVAPNGRALVPGDELSVRVEREVGYPDPELGLDVVRRGP